MCTIGDICTPHDQHYREQWGAHANHADGGGEADDRDDLADVDTILDSITQEVTAEVFGACGAPAVRGMAACTTSPAAGGLLAFDDGAAVTGTLTGDVPTACHAPMTASPDEYQVRPSVRLPLEKALGCDLWHRRRAQQALWCDCWRCVPHANHVREGRHTSL